MNTEGLRKRIKYLHPLLYRVLARTRPKTIEIQTTSVCNADCSFCPYPVVSREIPMGKMSDELFERVVVEAWSFGVRRFFLYFNNEPLTDPRIAERVRRISTLGGRTNLSTNGSLLTESRGREILDAGLRELVVNLPSVDRAEFATLITKLDFDTVMANVEALAGYHRNYDVTVCVQVNITPERDSRSVEVAVRHWRSRGLSVVLRPICDRAGNVTSRDQEIFLTELGGCRDFREVSNLSILFDGRAVLCCMDWRHTVVLGDASKQSLEEIYFGRPYFNVRREIQGLREPSASFVCRRCELAVPRQPLTRPPARSTNSSAKTE